MCQEEIIKLLKSHYPNSLSPKEMSNYISANEIALYRACKQLLKYNEIEFEIKQFQYHNGLKNVKCYRLPLPITKSKSRHKSKEKSK